MKNLKNLLLLLLINMLIVSCSDDDPNETIDETSGLTKIETIKNDSHTIELFNEMGVLTNGYNDIVLRIKENDSETYIENASITWKPMMHMTTMMHSCPKSMVSKIEFAKTLYTGYIVFQMPGNASEGWDLTINYTIDGIDYEAKGDIDVKMAADKISTVFMGTDDTRYVLSIKNPYDLEVKLNEVEMTLHKMEDMMTFTVVEDYKIMLDPRMPSMGNHSSPNNVDLTFNASHKMYEGKLSLTMTGLWRLNLMLLNDSGELLKGTEVTESNESSDLYVEFEF